MVLPHPGMVASPEWVTCISLASLSQAARIPEALMTCSLVLFGSVPWCGSGSAAVVQLQEAVSRIVKWPHCICIQAPQKACLCFRLACDIISTRSGKQRLSPGLQENGLGRFTRRYSAARSTFSHQLN